MLCLVINGAPASADSSKPAAASKKLPLVDPALVAADAARHFVDVRFSGEGLSTLSGTPLKVTQHPYQVKVRASVPELAGDAPSTLVFDDAEYEFVLRVSPSQLLSVVRTPVSLAPTPKEIGGSPEISAPKIRIERGSAVRVVERSGAAVKIALFERHKAAITGWVPASAIGPSFQAKEDEEERAFARLKNAPKAKLAPEVSLRSKPDGGSEIINFAALLGSTAELDMHELKRKSGAVLVVGRYAGWSATGWVSAKDVLAAKPVAVRKIKVRDRVEPPVVGEWEDGDALEGPGEEDQGSGAPEALGLMVEVGTPLLAGPGGEQIGWATVAHRVAPAETIKDAYRLRVDAPFGELDVWVSQAGLSPPPPPPPPPAVIAPAALEQRRIAGEKIILPDPVDQRSIAASGKTKLVTTYKICIDAAGVVSQVAMLKSSGVAGYDAKISSTMKTWRYTPYQIDGVAKPVCTSVTFIYSQKSDPPPPTP